MHVEDHVPLAKLKRLARSEREAKLSKRYQIIVLAIEGYTAPAIARSLGLSCRPCQQWVQRFNEEGLAGLYNKPGRGRLPLLKPDSGNREP